MKRFVGEVVLKKQRIDSLTGLKVIATLGIFYWHSVSHTGLPALGARLCEIFFVISGFLVAYNRHGQMSYDVRSLFDYVRNKIQHFYPAYSVGFFIELLHKVIGGGLSVASCLSAVWYLALVQAWMPSSIAFDWNGAAWFISSLVFCYACVPMLQYALETARSRFGGRSGSFLLFLLVLLVRFFFGLCAKNGYPLSEHLFPPVRLTEFFLAYIVGASFSTIRDRYNSSLCGRSSIASSVIELTAAGCYLGAVWACNTVLPRSVFVLFALVLVVVLSLECGAVSKVLSSRPLRIAGSIELEFYLLHQSIIRLVSKIFSMYSLGGYKKVALASFVITVVLAVVLKSISEKKDKTRSVGFRHEQRC